MAKKGGRLWVAVMLFIIVILPLFSVILLRKGFNVREEAPASERLIQNDVKQVPDYFTVSHRGDTITKQRMSNKVTIHDFVSYQCGTSNDAKERKLFEMQEDYYGKTKTFRIISHTLQPNTDGAKQLKLMAERYAAREIWHFVGDSDSSSLRLYDYMKNNAQNNSINETDPACPQLVFLVDGEGNLRGSYDPLDTKQNQDLYNDILFLLNKLDFNEEKE